MMLKTLKEGLPELGLELSDEICNRLCDFGKAMVKQNEVMNLTGITEDSAVAKLHLLDSLTVMASAVVPLGVATEESSSSADFLDVSMVFAAPIKT